LWLAGAINTARWLKHKRNYPYFYTYENYQIPDAILMA